MSKDVQNHHSPISVIQLWMRANHTLLFRQVCPGDLQPYCSCEYHSYVKKHWCAQCWLGPWCRRGMGSCPLYQQHFCSWNDLRVVINNAVGKAGAPPSPRFMVSIRIWPVCSLYTVVIWLQIPLGNSCDLIVHDLEAQSIHFVSLLIQWETWRPPW